MDFTVSKCDAVDTKEHPVPSVFGGVVDSDAINGESIVACNSIDAVTVKVYMHSMSFLRDKNYNCATQ